MMHDPREDSNIETDDSSIHTYIYIHSCKKTAERLKGGEGQLDTAKDCTARRPQ